MKIPKNGKLKPRIRTNTVNEMVLFIDHKPYSVLLCNECCLKIYEHRNKKNDHSNKARYGNNWRANNRVKNVGLTNGRKSFYSRWTPILEAFGQKKFKCDFCSGKYDLEFFMNT